MRRAVVSILAIVSIILLPFICAAQAGNVAGAAGDDGGGDITGTIGMVAGAVSASADARDGNGVRAATEAAVRSLKDAGEEEESYRFEFMWPDNPWYFNEPMDVAIDNNDCVYVADLGNNRVQKFTSDGEFITEWGSEGSGDGEFTPVVVLEVGGRECNGRSAIALAPGVVYTTDFNGHRVHKFSRDGQWLLSWGSQGAGQGEFMCPQAIAAK